MDTVAVLSRPLGSWAQTWEMVRVLSSAGPPGLGPLVTPEDDDVVMEPDEVVTEDGVVVTDPVGWGGPVGLEGLGGRLGLVGLGGRDPSGLGGRVPSGLGGLEGL